MDLSMPQHFIHFVAYLYSFGYIRTFTALFHNSSKIYANHAQRHPYFAQFTLPSECTSHAVGY